MAESNYHPSTGTIHLRTPGELPKRTVGKRLGVTAFVLSFLPLGLIGFILILSFLEHNVPGNTGIGYVVRLFWYLGIVLIPLLCALSLIVALIGVFRPSIMGKVWSILAVVIVVLTVLSFIFGYFSITR